MNVSRSNPDRVAVVHDWLVTWRGGEQVLREFLLRFPEADLYSLIIDHDAMPDDVRNRRVTTGPVQKWPGAKFYFRWFLPLFPRWVEQWDLNAYDLVLSSSHCVAKGVIPRPDALHLAYLHTPMRYAWDQRQAYFGRGLRYRLVDRFFLHSLRIWDTLSSTRVDLFLANSQFVARRIWKYYRRNSVILYPPIRTEFFTPNEEPPEHFLLVTALVPYKRVAVVLEAFRRRPQYSLVVVGEGPMKRRWQQNKPPNVRFVGRVSDEELRDLYRRSLALVHPAIEDFGMVVAEALACGRPALVPARGGAAEVVRHGVTGLHVEPFTPDRLVEALDRCRERAFHPHAIRDHALTFSRERFQQNFDRILNWALEHHLPRGGSHEDIRLLDRLLEGIQ